MNGIALVEIEQVLVALLHDLDELIAGLFLVEQPVGSLDRPRGNRDQTTHHNGDQQPAIPKQQRRGRRDQGGGSQKSPLRAY